MTHLEIFYTKPTWPWIYYEKEGVDSYFWFFFLCIVFCRERNKFHARKF
jgi:hypothetical protein